MFFLSFQATRGYNQKHVIFGNYHIASIIFSKQNLGFHVSDHYSVDFRGKGRVF